jgi:hypothetical protein
MSGSSGISMGTESEGQVEIIVKKGEFLRAHDEDLTGQ